MLIAFLNCLSILFEFFCLIAYVWFNSTATTFLFWTLIFYGFVSSFCQFFMMFLIPLMIAARKSVTYEFTLAGTTIAVINLTYYVVIALVFGAVRDLMALNISVNEGWMRLFIIILLLCSTLAIWNCISREFNNVWENIKNVGMCRCLTGYSLCCCCCIGRRKSRSGK